MMLREKELMEWLGIMKRVKGSRKERRKEKNKKGREEERNK